MKAVFKPTKKKVVILVLVLVIIVGAVAYFNAKANAAMAAMEPQYNMATVEKKDLKKEVSVNGTIGSVDKKSVVADITGVEVTQVNVKVGDQVKAGDVICTFDSSSIDTKMANTQESADIAAKKSSQAVSDAQAEYNNAVADKNVNASRSAQDVADAQTVCNNAIGQRDAVNSQYQQAIATANQAQTAADQAKANLEAVPADADQATKEAAQKAYDDAQTTATAAAAARDGLKIDLDSSQAYVESTQKAYNDAVNKQYDTNVTDDRTVAKQDSALDSAKLDAQSVNSGDTAQALDDLQKQKDACTVVAPIDGTITSLDVETGDIYKGDAIATIQNENNLLVDATVDQYTISDISEGMSVIIKTDTTGDLEMPGTLSFVSPVPKSSIDNNGKVTVTTDYEIKATFQEQNERLRLGMNAKTTILIAEAKNVLSVPSSCVQTDGDRKYVTALVDEATGETKEIDVTTGLETDYDVEVQGKDLKEGMAVIIPDATTESATETDDVIYE